MKRLLLALLAIALAGCVSQGSHSVAIECVSLCESALANGTDLSAGPCLGLLENGYACDVAHSPRAAADDVTANQCEDWHSGKAKGFVEVTPECGLIRQYP
jgi:hypothetical protein